LAKVKTAVQMIAVVSLLLQWPFGPFLMGLATGITVISGLDYFYRGRRLFK